IWRFPHGVPSNERAQSSEPVLSLSVSLPPGTPILSSPLLPSLSDVLESATAVPEEDTSPEEPALLVEIPTSSSEVITAALVPVVAPESSVVEPPDSFPSGSPSKQAHAPAATTTRNIRSRAIVHLLPWALEEHPMTFARRGAPKDHVDGAQAIEWRIVPVGQIILPPAGIPGSEELGEGPRRGHGGRLAIACRYAGRSGPQHRADPVLHTGGRALRRD